MMKIKKNTIIAIIVTFCFTATLFMVIPIRSSSIKPYDPWIDTDDNGRIDMGDIVNILDAFGATGTPINKTELLLELGVPFVNISGLIGYWRFNEGLGSIVSDSSGNNNDGILNGPARVDGKYGKALSFDGVNDHVELPNLDIVDGVSISAWVYSKDLPAWATILSRWYDGTEPDRGIIFQIKQGSYLRFGVIDDANVLDVPFSFEINKWYYMAATWNGSFSRVYVNGIEIGNRSTSGSFTNQEINLAIGVANYPFSGFFNGTIDNVMVYNRALNDTEVLNQYLNPPP